MRTVSPNRAATALRAKWGELTGDEIEELDGKR
jgi:hypothetical protein